MYSKIYGGACFWKYMYEFVFSWPVNALTYRTIMTNSLLTVNSFFFQDTINIMPIDTCTHFVPKNKFNNGLDILIKVRILIDNGCKSPTLYCWSIFWHIKSNILLLVYFKTW